MPDSPLAITDATIFWVTEYADQKARAPARDAGASPYVVKEELHKLRAVITADAKR